MSVILESQDTVNGLLKVVLTKEELKTKFKDELNKYQRKANINGFRKGKTPESVIRKMYGRELVFETVNELLTSNINSYIDTEKPNLFGSPIPSEAKESSKITDDFKEDLTFYYDLGFIPSIDLKGIEDHPSFDYYKVSISDDMITQELEYMCEKNGKQEPLEGGIIQDKDLIKMRITSTFDHVHTNECSVLFEDIYEESKDLFQGAEVGHTFKINPRLLDKKIGGDDSLKKYILNIHDHDDVPESVDVEIIQITRVIPAELNDDFIKQMFGEDVNGIDGAKEIIKQKLELYFEDLCDKKLLKSVVQHLNDSNPIELPDAFIKRYLQTIDDKNTPDLVEREYSVFAERLKWDNLKGAIAKKYELMVSDAELHEHFAQMLANYYGIDASHPMTMQFIERSMNDEQAVTKAADDIFGVKLIKLMKEKSTLLNKEVTKEEFIEIV